MKPTAEAMAGVAEELMGTCQCLDTVLGENGFDIDDVPIELLSLLDEQVMVCETCGWWCEPCELNEEQVCEDCKEG